MKIFELHFNPNKPHYRVETFQHKPESVYESRVGRIYMLGETFGFQRKDDPFLQNFFNTFFKETYSDKSSTLEKALQSSLVKLNQFIVKEEKENFNGLNIAVVGSKNFSLYISKIGDVKIILISKGKIIDIGKEIDDSDGNIFHSLIAEKAKKGDKLIVVSTDIYDFFNKNSIFEKITEEEIRTEFIDEISELHKKSASNSSGAAIIIDYNMSIKDGSSKKLVAPNRTEIFSVKKLLSETILPLIPFINNKKKKPKEIPPKKVVVEEKPLRILPKKPASLPKSHSRIDEVMKKKTLTLLGMLIIVIAIGGLMFGVEKQGSVREKEEILENIEKKIKVATTNNNLIGMKEVYIEASDLKKRVSGEVLEQLEEKLQQLEIAMLELSFATNTDDIELIAEFEENFSRIEVFANNIYLISNNAQQITILNKQSKNSTTHQPGVSGNVILSASTSNGAQILLSTNNIIRVEGGVSYQNNIRLPSETTQFKSMSSFNGRPYFLDQDGMIFSYTGNSPVAWIKDEESLAEDGLSIAIDGSVYVLTAQNTIMQYYRGELENSYTVNIFPEITNRDIKLLTNSIAPLIIADKKAGRIIIINKDGNLTKQLFNEKIKSMKDVTLSADGKKIYLLIGKEVYLLNL